MPAGVSWGQYMKFLGCALAAMMAGSQAVHLYYRPLEDLPAYIEREQHSTQVDPTAKPPDSA
ncbi:ubiquinol-cytochrome c reductase complex assembly factor 6 [Drosophila suzukii]|uniref:Ubiquinol-cytochrome c reductase complex assembly factor 6 n=1 Tax=Drosophila suzukii TaxID=28584 RepID=A0AB39ZLU2_DROSZ|nr:protein BRAWNIN [Drosophila suzukii]XP_037726806.1 protein BRAWNIN [Drosophila subpulchrella]